MTDYQTITVRSVDRQVIVIEVIEMASSRAIACLIDSGEARGIADGLAHTDPLDKLSIAAQLLLGEKGMDGELEPLDLDAGDGPETLVTAVEVIAAANIGDGDSFNAIYRATLRITLAKAEHARHFAVGESFRAVADIGNDFFDFFGVDG